MKNKTYYPETLKTLPIWILWRLESDPKGRATKVPYSAQYNGRASSTNPASWGTFNQAAYKYKSRPEYYSGIAIVISKDYGLVFIDIDHCVDEDGVFTDTAVDIINSFGPQYIEYSQSGTGIHIITKGTIPKSFKNSGRGVEMYNDKRFCALTGNVLLKAEPCEQQSVLDEIYQRYKIPEKQKKTVRTQNTALSIKDKDVIKMASKHGNFSDLYQGKVFEDKWAGVYGSQSEADLSLCMILAFWTDCNTEQIDRIFRTSGLYREKWERQDYREATIERAISQLEKTYSEFARERGEKFAKELSQRWDS